MESNSRYNDRGVSSSKEGVHKAIASLDKGLFPGAFCRIFRDIADDPDFCTVQHADGVGTKGILSYLHWKETGELKYFKSTAQDSFVMNLDDMACVGTIDNFFISMTIDRNTFLITDEVTKTIIDSCNELCHLMNSMDIRCEYTSGETADVNDVVRTFALNNTFTTRMKRSDVIDASNICAPALIVGFSSVGQAVWEDKPNSGIGSNGLTNARHDVLSPYYKKYMEAYCPEMDQNLVYYGPHKLEDKLPGDDRFTIGEALTSPTRTYMPLVRKILEVVGHKNIMGLIHCSGGGQTKIGGFGHQGTRYIKDNLFPIAPLFEFLQNVRNLPPREMFQSYNMGHRFEAVVADEIIANECIAISQSVGIEAQIVGRVVKNNLSDTGRAVIIESPLGNFTYEK